MPGFNSMFEGGGGATVVTGADVAAVTVQNEVPGGLFNNSNTLYTTAFAYIAGTLQVYFNGELMEAGALNDYTETTSTSFTMNDAPKANDKLLVTYIKA